MLTLTITSRPISKKNSKRRVKRGRKIFMLPSVAYGRFCITAKQEIKKQLPYGHKPLTTLLDISCEFTLKGRIRADLDNLYTGILDLLKDAGVIEDDNLVVSATIKKHAGGTGWHTLITITPYQVQTLTPLPTRQLTP